MKQARSSSKIEKQKLESSNQIEPISNLKTLLMPTTLFPLLVSTQQKLNEQKIDFNAVKFFSKLYSPYNQKFFGNHNELVIPIIFEKMLKLAVI